MAMTACAAKFSNSFDLLVGEWKYLLPVDRDSADKFILFEHGDDNERAGTGTFDERYDTCMAANVSLVQHQIRDVHDSSLIEPFE
jgi:hypothetical protein